MARRSLTPSFPDSFSLLILTLSAYVKRHQFHLVQQHLCGFCRSDLLPHYTKDWQIIEERVDGGTLPAQQYVWGIRYVDELICREGFQRYYALQDANFNLTSISDTSGAIQERYVFMPYGQRTIYDSTWSTVRSSSSYAWTIAHQGLLLDPETSLVYNRNRYLHPLLGRFLQRDMLGYVDGMSLYEYVASRPTVRLDPHGLQSPIALPQQATAITIAAALAIAYEAYSEACHKCDIQAAIHAIRTVTDMLIALVGMTESAAKQWQRDAQAKLDADCRKPKAVAIPKCEAVPVPAPPSRKVKCVWIRSEDLDTLTVEVKCPTGNPPTLCCLPTKPTGSGWYLKEAKEQ